jgi:hypothetical protein
MRPIQWQRELLSARSLAAWEAMRVRVEATGALWDVSPLAWRFWWRSAVHGQRRAVQVDPWRHGYSADVRPGARIVTADDLVLRKTAVIGQSRPARTDGATRFRPGAEHARARPVITPSGRYASAGLAARAHGISRQAAAKRARAGICGWAWA